MTCEKIPDMACSAIIAGLLRERTLAENELERANDYQDNEIKEISDSLANSKLKRIKDAFKALKKCDCGLYIK